MAKGKPDKGKKPLISTNPLERPAASPELLALAKELDQKIVHISLTIKPTPENPMIEGRSFLALMDFLPRVGDFIRTQNGKSCTVTRVLHLIRSFEPDGKAEAFGLFIPNGFCCPL
jgi:hypothetical protein